MRAMRPDWAKRLGDDHVLDASVLATIGATALTSDAAIAFDDEGLPTTFVPGRNLLFLTLAAAVAARRELTILVGGMCETDFSGYPDCRDDTVKAMQLALNLGHEPALHARDAADVARQGRDVAPRRVARRRGVRRLRAPAHAHLLPRRPHPRPRVGQRLRDVPGMPAAGARLCALSRRCGRRPNREKKARVARRPGPGRHAVPEEASNAEETTEVRRTEFGAVPVFRSGGRKPYSNMHAVFPAPRSGAITSSAWPSRRS